VQVKAWAQENQVPASTVFSAIQFGQIARAPDGGIDPDDAASWLRSRQDRIREDHAAGAARDRARQRELDAMAAEAITQVHRLTRQIEELRLTTVPADTIEPARDRRWARLEAALRAMPAHNHTAEVADAVGAPPAAVARVMVRLVELVARDLGELADR
jgi:hypothetical protein